MKNKKVLSGPRPSTSLYDIIPTIVFGGICVVLISYGEIIKKRNNEEKCLNRDCQIFNAPYPPTGLTANLVCNEEWNKTINLYSETNSTLTTECHDDGISKCRVIHSLLCQSCNVCFYNVSVPCYPCQKSLQISITKEGIESLLPDTLNISSWKKIGFMKSIENI